MEDSHIYIGYPCCGFTVEETYKEYGSETSGAIIDRVSDEHEELCSIKETPMIEITGRYYFGN